MKVLIVGGTFDVRGGKPSKIIYKLADSFIFNGSYDGSLSMYNGGTVDKLYNIDYKNADVLIWAPNISNDYPKILPDIKKQNPKMLLVSSKRVVEKHYTESDIIGRLLKFKSNLGIMITKEDSTYRFKLLDPLGNCYSDTTDLDTFGDTLVNRVLEMRDMNRIGSKRLGDKREFAINPDFTDFVKQSATEFTKYVNAINPNRLLGNASTRCMFGFPAEKQHDRIFVTQRNIDKQLIETDGFVEVTPNENVVEYYGDKKPSVDTPIQVRLFNYYPNINYMIHGHVYVEGARFTKSKVPCGHIEEFDEIVELYPDSNMNTFAVNLKGHGCLLLADTVENLKKLSYYTSRPFPEY